MPSPAVAIAFLLCDTPTGPGRLQARLGPVFVSGFGNNTQQYPSLVALRAAYALGQITAAQFTSFANASVMNAQVQERVAADVLRAAGENP
jgi:hypothetical protein